MQSQINDEYKRRLSRYQSLLYGMDNHGVSAKYIMLRSLSNPRYAQSDEELMSKYDPLLFHFKKSLEVDLHLAVSKLVEGERSISKFIDYSITNRKYIKWRDENPPSDVLFSQKVELEKHRGTILSILGRRNKYYAHLDKEYFYNPEQIYIDFPLDNSDVFSLFRCIEQILSEHQAGLDPNTSIGSLAGWFQILVDNMMRRLELGMKADQ